MERSNRRLLGYFLFLSVLIHLAGYVYFSSHSFIPAKQEIRTTRSKISFLGRIEKEKEFLTQMDNTGNKLTKADKLLEETFLDEELSPLRSMPALPEPKVERELPDLLQMEWERILRESIKKELARELVLPKKTIPFPEQIIDESEVSLGEQ